MGVGHRLSSTIELADNVLSESSRTNYTTIFHPDSVIVIGKNYFKTSAGRSQVVVYRFKLFE